MHIDKYRKFV